MTNPDPSQRTRFTPGQSGNPGGRPKRRPLTDAVRAILDDPAAAGSLETKAERVARTLVGLAIAGDMAAAKLVLAYTEGPPRQQFEFDYKRSCREFADRYGLDADELIAEAEAIARRAMDGADDT